MTLKIKNLNKNARNFVLKKNFKFFIGNPQILKEIKAKIKTIFFSDFNF